MCLGIPGRVIEVIDPANKIARVDVKGTPRNVSLALLPADETAGPGDLVLVHLGFAMSRLTEAEAAETAEMLEGFGDEFETFAAAHNARTEGSS
ncbi:MAG: HypC/HybG/HupF family hydrogenase formation chaperone [Candidatus Dormibacteraceae bacterium]